MKPLLSTLCWLLACTSFAGSSTIVFHSSTPDSGVGVVLSTEVTNATVTANPSSTTVLTNSDAEFSATAGGNLLSYYWITNSVLALNGDDVSGAFTTSLVLSNVVIGQSNMPVAFIVSNYCGVVTSTVAILTVTNSPGGGGGGSSAGLSNYWKFDETLPFISGLVDSVGAATVWTNSDTGTGFNSLAGVLGNCVTFTASHTCSATTNSAVALGDSAWTVTGWVNFTTLEAAGAVLSKGAGSSREILVRETSADSKLHLAASTTSDTWDKDIASGVTVSTATWYFFAGVHDPASGGTLTLYLKDTSVSLSTNTLSSVGTLYNNTSGGIYFGSHFGSGNDLNAKIDEIGIWKKAMTAEEVADEWNNGVGRTHP